MNELKDKVITLEGLEYFKNYVDYKLENSVSDFSALNFGPVAIPLNNTLLNIAQKDGLISFEYAPILITLNQVVDAIGPNQTTTLHDILGDLGERIVALENKLK